MPGWAADAGKPGVSCIRRCARSALVVVCALSRSACLQVAKGSAALGCCAVVQDGTVVSPPWPIRWEVDPSPSSMRAGEQRRRMADACARLVEAAAQQEPPHSLLLGLRRQLHGFLERVVLPQLRAAQHSTGEAPGSAELGEGGIELAAAAAVMTGVAMRFHLGQLSERQ